MKKRTVGILAGVALGVYVVSHGLGQSGAQQTQQTAPLQTRVALINLRQVIKNYTKFQSYEKEVKAQVDEFQKKIETKRAKLIADQGEMAKTTTTATLKDQLEHEVKQLQREMQDMSDEAKTSMSKRDFDQFVLIYKEIHDAVDSLARQYGIEMVLQYNDSPGAEAYSPQNFQPKLASPTCFPIYFDNRMDITKHVTDMLNSKYAGAAAAPGNTTH